MPGKEGRIEIIGSPYPTGAVQSNNTLMTSPDTPTSTGSSPPSCSM
nr:hypothetical protein Iba_chr03aCG0790 [Ipomoea batatas]GMC77679.1 hypothetical protein Iba_chr03fCG0810 [Ipomoea batatas]